MSETGQGLLDSSRADEMSPGSDIKNLWGKYMLVYSLSSLLTYV